MSGTVEKKRDDAMHIVADLCFYDDWDWDAYRVVQDADGLYLMTDSGCSCYSAFEYVDGLTGIRDFQNETGEQFMDHATGPLTRFQVLAELMSLLGSLNPHSIDEEDIEKAVHDILATNINKTNKQEVPNE